MGKIHRLRQELEDSGALGKNNIVRKDVQSLKTRTTKLENRVSELEQGISELVDKVKSLENTNE